MPIRTGYLLLLASFLCISSTVVGQDDTTSNQPDSFFLLRYNGILGKIARNIVADTSDAEEKLLQRNDQKFQRFRGRVIREIDIRRVPFGTPITDTSRQFTNALIRMANFFHRETRPYVIRNNLFFRSGDRLFPYLMADNERHLRDLEFLGDARILVRQVHGTRDSVDILVLTKDVLSIGGGLQISSINRIKMNLREANLHGWGDKIEGRFLYDTRRANKMGAGIEYTRRNIMGSFVDVAVGWLSITPTIIGGWEQEKTLYARMIRPLVHPYMRWTYAFEAAIHNTTNQYQSDSLYSQDYNYSYYNIDAWGGFTSGPHRNAKQRSDERLRTLIGARILKQQFQETPAKYGGSYFYRYADITAVLGSLSIFRQDFYKTRYIYGFGRTEDVPEGIDVSLTTGWTRKQKVTRNYAGLGFQLSYFSKRDNYYNYTLKLGGFNYAGKYEDIDLLANLEFFSNLKNFKRFRQRSFVTIGITRQFNARFNEPLFLDSQYGLVEFSNDSLFAGDLRATLKAESVFFTNWSLIGFKFAPFVFANAAYLTGDQPEAFDRKLFPSVGGGLRTRNESLIFGTLEFRGFYFPAGNFYNDRFRFEFTANLKFKYNQQQIRKPDFVQFN